MAQSRRRNPLHRAVAPRRVAGPEEQRDGGGKVVTGRHRRLQGQKHRIRAEVGDTAEGMIILNKIPIVGYENESIAPLCNNISMNNNHHLGSWEVTYSDDYDETVGTCGVIKEISSR